MRDGRICRQSIRRAGERSVCLRKCKVNAAEAFAFSIDAHAEGSAERTTALKYIEKITI